jgi:nucleoside-triphosphatase THEP1
LVKNASTTLKDKVQETDVNRILELNPKVLLIHGPIGSGKSRNAEQVVDRAKTKGYKVYGVISRRVQQDRETIGYDAYFPRTGETLLMVYKEPTTAGDQWETLRGPFKYNKRTFERANQDLVEAAHLMDEKTLVVADEFGHLEARGFGLYPGLLRVIEALPGGGRLLVPCRSDKVDNVLRLFPSETKVLIIEAGRKDFLASLGDSFI